MSVETLRAQLFPLDQLPDYIQERIAAQVACRMPPDRWHRVVCGAIPSRGWIEWHLQRGIDPTRRREPIPRSVRLAVLARDGLICQLCGDAVERNDVHLDHIKPYSKGGQTVIGNLQVTHSRCNMSKGARY